MSVVAALLSIALFLAFGSAGIQKLLFNPAMSKVADHLGFSRRAYQRIGAVEVLGAVALLAGLASNGNWLAVVNEVAAGGLTLLMGAAVITHLRKGDAVKFAAPSLLLGVAALVELVAHLIW